MNKHSQKLLGIAIAIGFSGLSPATERAPCSDFKSSYKGFCWIYTNQIAMRGNDSSVAFSQNGCEEIKSTENGHDIEMIVDQKTKETSPEYIDHLGRRYILEIITDHQWIEKRDVISFHASVQTKYLDGTEKSPIFTKGKIQRTPDGIYSNTYSEFEGNENMRYECCYGDTNPSWMKCSPPPGRSPLEK